MRILAAALCLLWTHAFSQTAAAAGWVIDEPLRFNLAYLPSSPERVPTDANPLLRDRDAFRPDVDNIEVPVLLDLGFPLPTIAAPEGKRLYIKLYAFPTALNPVLSAGRALDPFLLGLVEGGDAIADFARARDHLAVKFSVIADRAVRWDAASPFPPLTLSRGTVQQQQSEFDGSVPFASLYVAPTEGVGSPGDDAPATRSAGGVVAFHHDLLAAYRSALIEVAPGATSDRFIEMERCPAGRGKVCELRILTIAKAPMIFANWRDLPMPQDPSGMFLSGLLLIRADDYALDTPAGDVSAPGGDIDAVLAKGRRTSSRLLEVASVVRLESSPPPGRARG